MSKPSENSSTHKRYFNYAGNLNEKQQREYQKVLPL